jgi:hypothetical protein
MAVSSRPFSGFLPQLAHGQLGNYRFKDENRRSRLGQPEISRGVALTFYAYSARLLLFACSCASSDSASLPLR